MAPASARSDVGPLIERFAAAALRFGPGDSRVKLGFLARLAASRIDEPDALRRLHDTLCFLQAYADDDRVLAGVDQGLEALPARIARLGRAARHQLRDSGIAGTTLEYPFGFAMARWLSRRFPRHVGVAWKRFTKYERLREVLGLLVHPMEEEAFSEFGLPWRRWLQLGRAGRTVTDVQLLVELFERSSFTTDARDALFDSLGLPITWTLHGPGASRTLARLPSGRPFLRGHRPLGARRARDPVDAAREIARPLASVRRAARALGAHIVDAARLGLALRCRELHGISYGNPEDVLLTDVGRGLRIALIGVLPGHRLPLESFFGYLMLQNGVPIGYGGAWQLFGTLEFGVNIFDTFRRGRQSALVAMHALRLFHHALRMRAVVLQPFQIGQGNPEAIESAAFHFYYRIGFRPDDPAAAEVARREQARIAGNPSYRTSVTTLKRLADSEMYLNIAGDRPPSQRVKARQLAALVTQHVARNFGGDRDAAARWAFERLMRALGVSDHERWPAGERRAFAQLSLLAALVPDLERWPVSDKTRLVRALRAKGGRSEVPFVRLLDGHRRFQESLRRMVTAGAAGVT